MYKATNEESINKKYQLKIGLNTISDLDTDHSTKCGRGLYFCRSVIDVLDWAARLNYDYVYDATLPEDAIVIDYPTKSRTDRLILANKRSVNELVKLMSPMEHLSMVEQNGDTIQYLTDNQRTTKICLAAVKQKNGCAIQYLTDNERTSEICLAAVQHNGRSIPYLTGDERTPKVCLATVQQDGCAIIHLTDNERTSEVCLAAVQQNGCAILLLSDDKQTPEVCLAAVQQNRFVFEHLNYNQKIYMVRQHRDLAFIS